MLQETKDVRGSGRALSALALLEASRRNNRNADRLDLFMPLVELSLVEMSGVSFTVLDLQKEIVNQFALSLPLNIVKTLLARCANRQLVSKENGSYVRTEKPIQYSQALSQKKRLEEDLDWLVKEVKKYIDDEGLVEFKDSDSTLKHELIDYLKYGFGDMMFSVAEDQEELAPFSLEGNVWPYFLADRIGDDSRIRNVIDDLVKGYAVYNASFFPGFASQAPSFQRLIVYLDAPVLCWALGMSTPVREKYIGEVLLLLKSAGVVCRVFEHTIDEVNGILYWIEQSWGTIDRRGGEDSFLHSMALRGMTANDVFELRNSLHEVVSGDLSLVIEPAFSREPKHVGDESALAQRLASEQDTPGQWSNRVSYDVRSVAEILRIREGKEARSIQQAKAICLTISPRTLKSIKDWWIKDEGHSTETIPPALSMEAIANYVWLANPTEQMESINGDKILITCATAMAPSPEVWSECIARLDHLVSKKRMTEEKAAAIILNSDIGRMLKDEERKNPSADCIDYERVFEAAENKMAMPKIRQQADEYEEKIRQVKGELEDSQSMLSQEARRRCEVEQKLDDGSEEIERIRNKLNERESSIERACRGAATFLACFLILVLLAAIPIIFPLAVEALFPNDGSYDNAFWVTVLITLMALVVSTIKFKAIKECIANFLIQKFF